MSGLYKRESRVETGAIPGTFDNPLSQFTPGLLVGIRVGNELKKRAEVARIAVVKVVGDLSPPQKLHKRYPAWP